ncbi:6474_t:CDS:10 [Entrophospora sp. SA101]|nr:6474_t:CDS:10 [Entrophospora sp. SA101]
MNFNCSIQVRLEGHDKLVDVGYSQGTSVQAVLERACKTLGIYDSWNYALFSELFKDWICESNLLSSRPAEDTVIVRKKTPEYIELVYEEEHPKKRNNSSASLTPSSATQTKRRGVFSNTKITKTCLKTKFQSDSIYISTILFTSDSKILLTSSTRMFPTVEIVRDNVIYGNFEDDSDEFAHVLKTSLDWATNIHNNNHDNDESSDTDSLHSSHSNYEFDNLNSNYSNLQNQYYGDQDSTWSREFGSAALKLKNELSLETLGTLYEHVVKMSSIKSKFIITVQHVPDNSREDIAPDLIKSGILKWKNFNEASSIYYKEPTHPIWTNFIEKWCSRQTKLSPGLYLGVLYTESNLQGIRILVPKDRKQFIPLGKIRDEATITPEEASWIKSLACLSQDCFMDLSTSAGNDDNKSNLGQFQSSFIESYFKLQKDTSLIWDSSDIYNEQTIDIYLDLQTNQMYTMMASTCGATSLGEETAPTMTSSISSFNIANTIRPFIRIVLIVKPMRQPHQVREVYKSELCVLYPFPLYDALQHATFNTSLYAYSRRSMQILQASRIYFTGELVRLLQQSDTFSQVNEQNLDDFFFDPEEYKSMPEDARKVQHALDIIRDEIHSLRQQWNSASWSMTAIEWDRQRTMLSYNFGGRSMTLNISKTNGRASSICHFNNNHSNNSDSHSKRLSSTLKPTTQTQFDTMSQIEFLKDVVHHAPDRAWNNIFMLGVTLPNLSSSNDISNNASSNNNNSNSIHYQSDQISRKDDNNEFIIDNATFKEEEILLANTIEDNDKDNSYEGYENDNGNGILELNDTIDHNTTYNLSSELSMEKGSEMNVEKDLEVALETNSNEYEEIYIFNNNGTINDETLKAALEYDFDSDSTSASTTTTTSATDTPLSSRESSSPSTPLPRQPPSTPINGFDNYTITHSSILRSAPPTPSTPYFPAVTSLSSEKGSNFNTTMPSIPSSPSTPQFSSSLQNTRPSTPVSAHLSTLFDELNQISSSQQLTFAKSPPRTLYDELSQHNATSIITQSKSTSLPTIQKPPPLPLPPEWPVLKKTKRQELKKEEGDGNDSIQEKLAFHRHTKSRTNVNEGYSTDVKKNQFSQGVADESNRVNKDRFSKDRFNKDRLKNNINKDSRDVSSSSIPLAINEGSINNNSSSGSSNTTNSSPSTSNYESVIKGRNRKRSFAEKSGLRPLKITYAVTAHSRKDDNNKIPKKSEIRDSNDYY